MNWLKIKKWYQTDFVVTVKNEDTWEIIDLSEYDWVDFVMVDSAWLIVVNWAGSFITPKTNWQIKYDFLAWDVDTIWNFKAYFWLKKSWVKKLAVPTTFFPIEIVSDLL